MNARKARERRRAETARGETKHYATSSRFGLMGGLMRKPFKDTLRATGDTAELEVREVHTEAGAAGAAARRRRQADTALQRELDRLARAYARTDEALDEALEVATVEFELAEGQELTEDERNYLARMGIPVRVAGAHPPDALQPADTSVPQTLAPADPQYAASPARAAKGVLHVRR